MSEPTTGPPRNRFVRYLHDAAQERARERAIAPDMDAIRWEGLKLMFVGLPLEVARAVFFLFMSIVLLFFFWMLVPFLTLFPDALLGASHFAKEQMEGIKDEACRRESRKRQFDDWHRRWKQRREELQNAR